MKIEETIEQRARKSVRFTIQLTINDLRMTSTTTRSPIKPKTLTLLELCQSITDFRHPPPSLSSYQSSPNAAQILTRRLYLHPVTINPNPKHSSSKTSTANVTPSDIDQRQQLNSERKRQSHNSKHKSHRGLAVLSSSFPLMTRLNTKIDTRHSRDKTSINTDDDTNSEYDASTTTVSLNQPSLASIARGTSSSTHTMCNRPSCLMSHQKTNLKQNRWEKVDVWHHLDQALQRPIPNDPPTTPLNTVSDFRLQNDEQKKQYINYNSIQEIKIYKRNPIRNSIIHDNDDIYDEEFFT